MTSYRHTSHRYIHMFEYKDKSSVPDLVEWIKSLPKQERLNIDIMISATKDKVYFIDLDRVHGYYQGIAKNYKVISDDCVVVDIRSDGSMIGGLTTFESLEKFTSYYEGYVRQY